MASVSDCSGVLLRMRRVQVTLPSGASNVSQHRIRARPPEMRVHAAAIAVAARGRFPGLRILREIEHALRLRRKDARAADRLGRAVRPAVSATSRTISASSRSRDCRASSMFCGSRSASSRAQWPTTADRWPLVTISRCIAFTSQPRVDELARPASRAAPDASAACPACRNRPPFRPGRGRRTSANRDSSPPAASADSRPTTSQRAKSSRFGLLVGRHVERRQARPARRRPHSAPRSRKSPRLWTNVSRGSCPLAQDHRRRNLRLVLAQLVDLAASSGKACRATSLSRK